MIRLNFLVLTLFWATHSFSAPPQQTHLVVDEVASVEKKSSALGYQQWKEKQILTAQMALDEFKMETGESQGSTQVQKSEAKEIVENSGETLEKPKTEYGNESTNHPKNDQNTEMASVDRVPQDPEKIEKLRQLEFNLEIAKGLSIHDYFALYLKSKEQQEMELAIAQLTPQELSQLLMAYRATLEGPKASGQTKNNQ